MIKESGIIVRQKIRKIRVQTIYGFTEEELDFIISHDVRYRMGNNMES